MNKSRTFSLSPVNLTSNMAFISSSFNTIWLLLPLKSFSNSYSEIRLFFKSMSSSFSASLAYSIIFFIF